MDEPNPLDTLVMKYLDNEMPDTEKVMFEARLLSDPVLSAMLENIKLARNVVMYHGIHQQVGEVRKIFEQKHIASIKPVKLKLAPVRKMVQYSVAAACVFFAFMLIRGLFAPATPEKIYDEVYVGYQFGIMRSGGNNVNRLEQAYQEKKYSEVNRLAKDSVKSTQDQLLWGISLLNTGDAKQAVPVLRNLLANPDTTYVQDAEFYLGLAYLQAGLPGRSLELLSKIKRTPGHAYQKQVSEKTLEAIRKLL